MNKTSISEKNDPRKESSSPTPHNARDTHSVARWWRSARTPLRLQARA